MRLRRALFFALSFAFRRLDFLRLVLRVLLDSIRNMANSPALPRRTYTRPGFGGRETYQAAPGVSTSAMVGSPGVPSRPRAPGFRAPIAGLVAAGALAAALSACGASVSQKYESDVRFERCLALDWQQTVDPGIRHKCWDEWARFYAVGQPRDRIEYARNQVADIEGRAAGREAAIRAASLPEPKSVFEPVPQMATSASATPSAQASAVPAIGPSDSKNRPPCQAKCDKNLEGCLSGCKVGVCEQFCAQKHGRCIDKCASQPAALPAPAPAAPPAVSATAPAAAPAPGLPPAAGGKH